MMLVTKTASITTGAVSANVAIPTSTAGAPARAIRLVCSTGACWVKFGADNTVTAAAGDILITTNPQVLIVSGAYLAAIQESTASKLSIGVVET